MGAAGVLHLVIATQLLVSAAPASALFGAFGAAQLFWVLPTLMQWGRKWYYAGIT